MSDINQLNTISPVDGRYRSQTQELSAYFSESALIRYRLLVEVEYFIALIENGITAQNRFDEKTKSDLKNLYLNFTSADADRVKELERVTNHDVKALEYFLKEKISGTSVESLKEFIHFGLTSQDINNTAFPLSVKEAVEKVYRPAIQHVVEILKSKSIAWSKVAMLSRTHGQPASPTRLGKEFGVFVERIENQLLQLTAINFSAKFGGATGNFNAHHVAYPSVDWKNFANRFIESLGLKRQQLTTQIEHYDNLCALFDCIKRINNILIDLNRDVWSYISMDYFSQQIKENEVGSSAMPHKVNPIDFENSEGNLGMANALLEHLSAKLPISRLQRDLTDSTVLRNVGVPFAHTLIALKSLIKGLNKLMVNEEMIHEDLEANWIVVAEGIQTILRRENYPNPYEKLKAFTRKSKKPGKTEIMEFIESLDISDDLKAELKSITPFNYTGI